MGRGGCNSRKLRDVPIDRRLFIFLLWLQLRSRNGWAAVGAVEGRGGRRLVVTGWGASAGADTSVFFSNFTRRTAIAIINKVGLQMVLLLQGR